MSDETFNLDALLAETKPKEPFTFRFADAVYTLPGAMDIRAIAALTDGDIAGGFRIMLGKDQWDRLCAAEATLTIAGMSALLDRYAEYTGSSSGESSASTGSSRSTGGRSKRTSNGSISPSLVR